MFRTYTFPRWVERFYPEALWRMPLTDRKTLYITFDDGPYPESTPWLLDSLEDAGIKSTFFCTGRQMEGQPALFGQLKAAGHTVGSHTFSHLNGWKSNKDDYVRDVKRAAEVSGNLLFRPPYGRLRIGQYRNLIEEGYTVVFWTLMTYDFDATLHASARREKIQKHAQDGSIIVFHDSPKAFEQLKNELPDLIHYWKSEGYSFGLIPTA